MSAFPSDAGEGGAEEPLAAAPAGPSPSGGQDPWSVDARPGAFAGGKVANSAPAGEEQAAGEQAAGEQAAGEQARVAAERDEYLDALRRLQAEFDNYRKRTARQQGELLDRATGGLLERLLPVLDAIDLALTHRSGSPEGLSESDAAFGQIASLLRDLLAKDGLERIDAVGVHFDPAIHDAVAHLPAGGEPAAPAEGEAGPEGAGDEGAPATGTAPSAVVAEVLRAGYRLKGRVLRPAMVTVQG